MNEAIEYALDNAEKTRDIHDVIFDMKKVILEGLDRAIREAVPGWYDDKWKVHDKYNLHEHHWIDMRPKELIDKALWIGLDMGYEDKKNKDPVWQLLGMSSRHAKDEPIKVECRIGEEVLNDE